MFSVLYICAYLALGQLFSHSFFAKEKPLIRLWLGGCAALALLLWLPALFSFFLGFTLLSQLIALAVLMLLGALCAIKLKKAPPEAASISEFKPLLILMPLYALMLYLLSTHTLLEGSGALYAGQSTFGDLPLHLGLATSIAAQGTFPPEYSIFPGTVVGYPFLCDSVSSTFLLLGANLRFAMMLPAAFALLLVLLGVYCFFEHWLASKNIALFATLLFFIGGGFGFWYYFDFLKEDPNRFLHLFLDFYNTPTNNPSLGLRFVNPIADMLIPQRATLFGWALLFPCLYMLRAAAFENERKFFLPLAIFAGCLPMVHTHSFLALGLLSAVYFIRAFFNKTQRAMLSGWLLYGVLAFMLAAPQLLLFTFPQAGGFLKLHFNWSNELDTYLWFYIKNLGFIFILLPAAFFMLNKKERAFYSGAALIWLVAEFVQFQPNPYDNNKLLFIWFAYTCGIIALFLFKLYELLKAFPARKYLALVVLFCVFASGLLTLGREAVSRYELFSKDEVEASEYVKHNSAPDALFLTAAHHNNAVSSLTGRNILCGTGSYLYFHGIDFEEREAEARALFETPSQCFNELKSKYGIDYIWLGNAESYTYAYDKAFFSRFDIIFENDTVIILRID